MKRHASAVWKGGLTDGKGTVSSTSGAFSNVPYNFRMRFEEEPGTNPEELIAAAHSACGRSCPTETPRLPQASSENPDGLIT